MDIKKMIEQLRKEAYGSDIEDLLLEAATSISTLQAENETLRDELEQVKAERDAAVKCIEEIEDALNFQRISAIGLRISEWRGQEEE